MIHNRLCTFLLFLCVLSFLFTQPLTATTSNTINTYPIIDEQNWNSFRYNFRDYSNRTIFCLLSSSSFSSSVTLFRSTATLVDDVFCLVSPVVDAFDACCYLGHIESTIFTTLIFVTAKNSCAFAWCDRRSSVHFCLVHGELNTVRFQLHTLIVTDDKIEHFFSLSGGCY